MVSLKLVKKRCICKEKWLYGRKKRGIVTPSREVSAFRDGFNMAWHLILTEKKLYRTFNIHWETDHPNKSDSISFLKDNDGKIHATVFCSKSIKPFKYNIFATCKDISFHYEQTVDQNDAHKIRNQLRQKILTEYIKSVEMQCRQ